jgi:DNA polymerase IIIc chi subunit
VLINRGNDIPVGAGPCPSVAELVTSDEESKQLSRRRFAAYRDQGHELQTHNV